MQVVVPAGPGWVAAGASETSGQALTWTSPDGLSWTRDSGPAAIEGGEVDTLAITGHGLIVAGNDQGLWTSSDGTTWRHALRAVEVDVVVAGPNAIVAFGTKASSGSSPIVLADDTFSLAATPAKPVPPEPMATWISSDGQTWQQLDPPAFRPVSANVPGSPGLKTYPSVDEAVSVAGGFVAAGSTQVTAIGQVDQRIWTSTDGRSWDRATYAGGGGAVLAGTSTGLIFIEGPGQGPSDGVWTSPDGRSWSHVADPPELADLGPTAAVAVPGGFLLAANLSGNPDDSLAELLTSADGRAWTALSAPTPPAPATAWSGSSLSGVAAGPACIVAVGSWFAAPGEPRAGLAWVSCP